MSKIRRLSIRGIRNFDDNEDAILRFSCPMTLILGPNGTGKTTIIEALKYATTGGFPPEAGGKNFIHDPNLVQTGSVRGVVKAEIVDPAGTTYTVCRTIECIKNTMRFKTLDTTLTRVSKDKKEKSSITNRCVDIDVELCAALGVSKSILNYVIFCHQDELNWPFDHGKPLKERFDEIFDSTKFNRALESIAKLQKDLQGNIRGLTLEKKSLYIVVSEVDSKESALEDYKQRFESTTERIGLIDKELESLNVKIKEMEQFHSEYKSIQADEEKKKMEYNMHKERYIKLRNTIENIFEGTTEELNTHIQSYDSILKEKNDEITENETEIKSISAKENKISDILAMRRETVGTLKQQVKDHERRVVRRNQLLDDALQACDFDPIGQDVSEIEVKAFTKRLEQKMQSLEQELEEKQSTMQRQESELQKQLDKLRSNHSKIESEKILKEKEVVEIRNDVTATRNQIAQIGAARNKLKSLEQGLQAAKQKIDEISSSLDVKSVKSTIENNMKSRDKIETSLSAVDDEISILHKLSLLTADFELKKSMLQNKEEEFENLKKKHGEDIKTLLSIQELQDTKLKVCLERVHQQLEKEVNNLTSEIQVQERKTVALQTTVRHMESDIEKKQAELAQDKRRVSIVCDYKDFDETLLKQSKIVKNIQNQRGVYAYQSTAYKEYIKKLSARDPCCPLCHRDFQEQQKVTDLIKELEGDIIRNQPGRLKKCEEELKNEQKKYDDMLQLKPIIEKINQCEENDLKKLEEKLEKTKNNLIQSKTCIKNLEASKTEPEKKLVLWKNIIGDIQFWDRCVEDIRHLKKTVDHLQCQMSDSGIQTQRSIEEAQTQREQLKKSFKETCSHTEALQLKLNKYNERVQDARARYNELHEEQLQIQSDMQKLKHLKEKQEDLYTREVNVGEAVERLRKDLMEAEDEMNSAIRLLEKTKTENWQKHKTDRNSMVEATRRLSDLHKIIDEVESFFNSNVSEKLASYERDIETNQKSLAELTNRRKNVEQAIGKLKEDVASQEIRKREMLDNVTLRETKKSMETLKERYEELNSQLKSMNYDETMKNWKLLEDHKQTMLSQRNVSLGKKEELGRQIKQYKVELQKEEYRLARRNYMNKCIELTVQKEVIVNLKAYSMILDKAMIEYHEERMATVNKIMKKMWKHVYKGSDTTCIQISTEATEGVGTGRRSYNYKLIQTKHGHEMDMRGRCSAGQKMLASIIIRLALAETFCKDCGILALDEPTTNLDTDNANSLADMLTKVVEMRSRHQKNFQLIIISHDEKFLQKLAYLNNHKQFHELYRKDRNGLTSVKISHFNEPTSSLVLNIKDEDESDDEERHRPPSRDPSNDMAAASTSKKRFNWDDFDNEEERPTKKRFCSNE